MKKKRTKKENHISPPPLFVGNIGVVMFSLQIQGLFLSVVRRTHTIPLYLPLALVQTCAQRSSSNPAAPKNKRTREMAKIERQTIHVVIKSRGFGTQTVIEMLRFQCTPCLSLGIIFHCTKCFSPMMPETSPFCHYYSFWYLFSAGTNKTIRPSIPLIHQESPGACSRWGTSRTGC